MNYIDTLINQAVDFVVNIDYATLAVKAIYKSAEFIIENGIDLIVWASK